VDMPELAMQFESPVQRLQWVGGRYVVGYSENDSEVQVFNAENESVMRFRLDSGVTAKNGSMDPIGKYFAVSTTDGHAYIFVVPSEGSNIGEIVKKIKITKLKLEAFGSNPFEISWTPDGSALLVSGENNLGVINRDTWEINYSKDFAHKKPITCISWLTDSVLATAGLDKIIKIWDFPARTLTNYIITPLEVT
jgi:WD40 repeat protein